MTAPVPALIRSLSTRCSLRLALSTVALSLLVQPAVALGVPGTTPVNAALPRAASVPAHVVVAGVARAEASAAAARIDRIADKLRGSSAPIIDDQTFVRRAYLDVVGRIPSLTELVAFEEDRRPDRRERLIDRLLASPGHRSHMANLWGDLLRVKEQLAKNVSGEPLRHWVRESIEEGAPYDEMVRELLVAEGPAHEMGNGATGHLMRDSGMLEDSMANTVRAFLGTRIECAQCHDHPFEPWTQEQFFGMVAFTGGMQHKLPMAALPGGDDLMALRERLVDEHGRNGKQAFTKAVRPLMAGVRGMGTAQVQIPEDAPSGAGEIVRATTFTGDVIGPDPEDRGRRKPRPVDVGSRESLADWIVGNGNGLFARVVANRMWNHLMGRGVVEPLDDVWSGEPRDAALMNELERLMVSVDYDLTAFQRAILSTDAWGATALPNGHVEAGLTAPEQRRLSAEQLWDSLVTLVVDDIDGGLGPALLPSADEVYSAYAVAAADPVGSIEARFGDRLMRATDKDAYREVVRDRKRDSRREKDELRDETRPLRRALRKANKKGDEVAAAAILERLAEVGAPVKSRAELRDLFRASELEQPAPPDHLLARYGQSDREQIGNGHRDDTVPQVLALLNGFVERELLDDRADAVLVSALHATPNARARIETAWLGVLGREPTADERDLWLRDLESGQPAATHDMLWCLVNTHEFQFTP